MGTSWPDSGRRLKNSDLFTGVWLPLIHVLLIASKRFILTSNIGMDYLSDTPLPPPPHMIQFFFPYSHPPQVICAQDLWSIPKQTAATTTTNTSTRKTMTTTEIHAAASPFLRTLIQRSKIRINQYQPPLSNNASRPSNIVPDPGLEQVILLLKVLLQLLQRLERSFGRDEEVE